MITRVSGERRVQGLRDQEQKPPVLSLRTGRRDTIMETLSKDPKSLLGSELQVGDYSKSPRELAIS